MYEMKITAATLPELGERLYVLGRQLLGIDTADAAIGQIVEEPVVGKPKRTRKVAPVEEAPAAEAEPVEEVPAAEPGQAAGRAQDYDFDRDIAPIVLGYVDRKGKPFVVDILTQFGVAKASQIPNENIPEFLSALEDAA